MKIACSVLNLLEPNLVTSIHMFVYAPFRHFLPQLWCVLDDVGKPFEFLIAFKFPAQFLVNIFVADELLTTFLMNLLTPSFLHRLWILLIIGVIGPCYVAPDFPFIGH